jgi:hypothetical protein
LKKALETDKRLAVEVFGSQGAFDKAFEGVQDILIDGFEVPVERDKDKRLQAEDYSGKKCHTKIGLCASDRAGRAIYVGKLKAGHKVDFKLFDDRDAARKKKMFLIVLSIFFHA